ncbi:MAG: HlyD family type I secretion periplasmic adaptor subunit [Methylobacter sp.]
MDKLEQHDKHNNIFLMFFWTLISFFLLVIIWAILTEIDVFVTGTGQTIVDGADVVIYPFSKSVIKDINVKVADEVKKGDKLVSMIDTSFQAQVDDAAAKIKSVEAKLIRLKSELDNTDLFLNKTELSEYELNEKKFYEYRKKQYLSESKKHESKIKEIETEIQANNKLQSSLSKELENLKDIEAMYEELFKVSNGGSKVQWLEAKQKRMAMLEKFTTTEQDGLVYKQSKITAINEYELFKHEWISTIQEELVESINEMHEFSAKIKSAELEMDMSVLRSPMDAIVFEMGDVSVGSVVAQGDLLVRLIPKESRIKAELKILSNDIGYIAKGDNVVIKIDTLPYQKYGSIEGVIDVISEDSVEDKEDKEKVYYKVLVDLPNKPLGQGLSTFRLIPGETLQGEVHVGKRTIAEYFMHPILRGLDQSIREP